MKTFRQVEALREVPGPVHLAIGVFDGIHLGHRAVIERALASASRDRGSAVVVTFDPHPARVLRPPGNAPRLLASLEHKQFLLANLGVEFLLVVKFDRALAGASAEEFIERLRDACRPLRRICVGYDWRFGRDRAGDIHLLADLGKKFGFEVTGLPAVTVDGQPVSSTAIREAIAAGDLESASKLLGRNYGVWGTVTEGDRLGRQLGWPTANFAVQNEELPPRGVYAVAATIDGRRVEGVGNLGVRPTVAGSRAAAPLLEAHFFDFDEPLYGKSMEVRFLKFLRREKKFPSLDALKAQIAADADAARRCFG